MAMPHTDERKQEWEPVWGLISDWSHWVGSTCETAKWRCFQIWVWSICLLQTWTSLASFPHILLFSLHWFLWGHGSLRIMMKAQDAFSRKVHVHKKNPSVFLLDSHTSTTLIRVLTPDVRYQLCVLQFNSILTLSTWRQHQIPQVKGSVPQDLPPLPFQMPITGPGCHLCFWPAQVPTALSSGWINLKIPRFSMAWSFLWPASIQKPSRSPPKVASIEEKTLFLGIYKSFRSSVPGKGKEDQIRMSYYKSWYHNMHAKWLDAFGRFHS